MKDNNEQFEKFIRDFDRIRMTDEEKNEIQNNLILFTRSYIPKPSPYFSYTSFFRKTVAVTLILLLIISISKPASAKSLPGDLLYNVKIIHEEIESAIIQKPEKKVDFEIKRTKKRVQEAVILAKNNKLDENTQEKLADEIKKHVENVSAKIDDIKKESPEKALALNSDLKTTLKVSSKAIKKAVEENSKMVNDTDNTTYNTNEINQKNIDNSEKTIENKTQDNKNEEVVANNEENQTVETEEKSDETIEEDKNKEVLQDVNLDKSLATKAEEITTPKEENIILNSILDSIEETEIVSDDIENEILSEEPEKTDDSIINDNNTNTDEENVTQNEDNIEDENSIFYKETPVNIDENIEENDKVNVTLPEEYKTEIQNEETSISNEPINNNIEISDNIRSEIISLENVLEAEERLKELLNELSQNREEDEINLIKTLIEEKKLGQAYIEIQKKIESLTEIKLSKELGINEEYNKEEEDNNTHNTNESVISTQKENTQI